MKNTDLTDLSAFDRCLENLARKDVRLSILSGFPKHRFTRVNSGKSKDARASRILAPIFPESEYIHLVPPGENSCTTSDCLRPGTNLTGNCTFCSRYKRR